MKNKRVVVTGGAGFIGGALVRKLIEQNFTVLNIDSLTYASNLQSLVNVSTNENYSFKKLDICDENSLWKLILDFCPDTIMHLAAESHVDRSIDDPSTFLKTNILGTANLLNLARKLSNENKEFLFHHISTDEVYGDLSELDPAFTEKNNYDPSSPYSASKASSDHLVRSWSRTYGLKYVITNCSNNYGPFHFPEKFIPNIIIRGLLNKKINIYGDGSQIRDWLYVDDHADALIKINCSGFKNTTFNIGGNNELRNIDVAKNVCSLLDKLVPLEDKSKNYSDLITFVRDRPGHDLRYAIDNSKLKKHLNWEPAETFESGLEKTVKWYISNKDWWKEMVRKNNLLNRLGSKENE